MPLLSYFRNLSVRKRFAAFAVFFSSLVVLGTAFVLPKVRTSINESFADVQINISAPFQPDTLINPIEVRVLPIVFWGGHNDQFVNSYSDVLTPEFVAREVPARMMWEIYDNSRFQKWNYPNSQPNVAYKFPSGMENGIIIRNAIPKTTNRINPSPSHSDKDADYVSIVNNVQFLVNGIPKTICQLVNENVIDEVWIYAHRNGGLYEANMTGNFRFNTNGTEFASNCTKSLHIMGGNYEQLDGLPPARDADGDGIYSPTDPEDFAARKEWILRQLSNMHAYNHRIEGVLRAFNNSRPFAEKEQMARPSTPGARCGNAHFPPNTAGATGSYDWGNPNTVYDICNSWRPGWQITNYNGIPQINSGTWGGSEIEWQKRWMGQTYGANSGVVFDPSYDSRYTSNQPAMNFWELVTNRRGDGSVVYPDSVTATLQGEEELAYTYTHDPESEQILGITDNVVGTTYKVSTPKSTGACSKQGVACGLGTFATFDPTCGRSNNRCAPGVWVTTQSAYRRLLTPTEICPSNEGSCVCPPESVKSRQIVLGNQSCGGYSSLYNSCTSLQYSAWGPCVNGIERRVVLSRTPSNCNPSYVESLTRACGPTASGFKCVNNRCQIAAPGEATFADSATCGTVCEGQPTSACNGAESRVSKPGQALQSSLSLTCGEQYQVRSVRNGVLATGLSLNVITPDARIEKVANESTLSTLYTGQYRVQTWGTNGQCHEATVNCVAQSTPTPTPGVQPAAPTAVFSCYDLGPEIRDNRLTISWPASSQEGSLYAVHVSTNSNFSGYSDFQISGGAARTLTLTPNNFSALNTSDLRRYYVRLYYPSSGQHSKVLVTPIGDCQNTSLRFTDVAVASPTPHPFLSGIQKTVASGIMQGQGGGIFTPNNTLTRAQTAVVLNNAFSLGALSSPAPSNTSRTFYDVPNTHWAFRYVERMYSAGFTVGCGTTVVNGVTWKRFCPEGTINRQEIATFLKRGLNLPTDSASTAAYFSDVPSTYPTFFGFINAVGRRGIIHPKATCLTSPNTGNNKFCPVDVVNRGEMAKIIENLLYYRQDNP